MLLLAFPAAYGFYLLQIFFQENDMLNGNNYEVRYKKCLKVVRLIIIPALCKCVQT
jgi:hypothetical protein